MSCPKENFEILGELKDERKERRRRMNAKREYVLKSRRENPDVPVLDSFGEGDSGE